MKQTIPLYFRSTPKTEASPQEKIAFSDVYEAHHTMIYRYVLSRIGDRQDAHDVTAQTFLSALTGWQNYRSDAPVHHWLIGIARNKVHDFYRRQADEVSISELPALPHPAPLPEEQAIQQLRLERIARVIQSLSPDRQEVSALRLFAGLSNPEIADLLDKSTEAVAMLVHRALSDLKERLAEE